MAFHQKMASCQKTASPRKWLLAKKNGFSPKMASPQEMKNYWTLNYLLLKSSPQITKWLFMAAQTNNNKTFDMFIIIAAPFTILVVICFNTIIILDIFYFNILDRLSDTADSLVPIFRHTTGT